ncbi:MAG: hypothetical protein JXA57_18800 [Armatimonadetes bacterium]|nr:hypothetical protein [Armatimonadota bacterium]
MTEQQKRVWTVEDVLEFARSDGRVCPMPEKWKELYELLPDSKRKGAGWEPALPLILGGWSATHWQKRERLAAHIRYAAEHGVLQLVGNFLSSLSARDWYREGQRPRGVRR